eukprot:1259239-Rhodomonas_salina.1
MLFQYRTWRRERVSRQQHTLCQYRASRRERAKVCDHYCCGLVAAYAVSVPHIAGVLVAAYAVTVVPHPEAVRSCHSLAQYWTSRSNA